MFDNAHRVESAKLRKDRHHRTKLVLTATRPTKQDSPALPNSSGLPHTIVLSAEYNALGFFFHRYGLCSDVDASCDFFGVLPGIYTKATVASPLDYATRALALQVAHLHLRRGDRRPMGHDLYFKAVAGVKEALTVPAHCRSNELLLATLVLEEYDNINSTFGGSDCVVDQSSAHLRGSIALLQYRGVLNYADELAWRLVTATRNRLLHDSWHSADGIKAIQEVWDSEGADRPRGPAVEADTLAFRLCWLRHLHRSALADSLSQCRSRHAKIVDVEKLKDIVSQASHLANKCALLKNALPLSWQPLPVAASSLAKSLQAVSVYEHVPVTIYSQLSVANAVNRQRLTELGCISLISSCLATIAMSELQLKLQHESLPSTLLARVQVLVDEICATVPFLTGDVEEDASGSIAAPTVAPMSFVETGRQFTVPKDATAHTQQVVASGLYMMYMTLRAVLDFQMSDDVIGNSLRAGQKEWIVRQVNRLSRVFQFTNVETYLQQCNRTSLPMSALYKSIDPTVHGRLTPDLRHQDSS